MFVIKCHLCGKNYDEDDQEFISCPHCEHIKEIDVKTRGGETYTALCMSDSDERVNTQSGLTYAEALKHIESCSCKSCSQYAKCGGFLTHCGDDRDEQEWFLVRNILDTACGAEWTIITDAEWLRLLT